jgi:hypothetical protein
LRLRAFGIKTTRLADFGDVLASAGSMARSLDARRAGRCPAIRTSPEATACRTQPGGELNCSTG